VNENLRDHLGLLEVSQIGMVVENVDGPIEFFQSTLGIGPFQAVETPMAMVWDRGEEKPVKARLAFADLAGLQLELIQILEGDSMHLQFLREHGPGIHHLGFRVKDFGTKLDAAKRMGLNVLQTGPGGRFYAYLDAREQAGIIVELIEETAVEDIVDASR
jgi:catechol 2,3-dioxygenase-like lactoylglutathione lyase family enzyme